VVITCMATESPSYHSPISPLCHLNQRKILGAPSSFKGRTFVITGALPTMTREDVVTLIEKHGGRVCTKVSMVTTYLVTGTKLIGYDKRFLSQDVTTSHKYKEMLRVNLRKTSENLSETLLCKVLNESQLQQMASTEAGPTSTSQSDTTPQSASSLQSATSLLPAYSQPPASLQPASSHLVIWLKCSLFFTCC
jgi:hypothetical protein